MTVGKQELSMHSMSLWCSPVIVVDKKQIPGQLKEFRLVVDYRALNLGNKVTNVSIAINQPDTNLPKNELLHQCVGPHNGITITYLLGRVIRQRLLFKHWSTKIQIQLCVFWSGQCTICLPTADNCNLI